MTLHTTAQRSKSVHTSPLSDDRDGDSDNDDKLRSTRRSSDATSPTVLSDDENEVVKRFNKVCSYSVYKCMWVTCMCIRMYIMYIPILIYH